MFKGIKKSWSDLLDEKNFSLVKIRVGDVLFTPMKKEASKYNKNFPNNLTWSEDQVELREKIKNREYDPTNQLSPISITKNGVCVNGHHRLTSLIEYYGKDYVVTVRKLKVKYSYIFYLTIITLIFQPKLIIGK
jgi:hypothetical protein